MKTVSFVIPCYRSAKTVGAVTREIGETMAANARLIIANSLILFIVSSF